jgi:hypothetical protein
MSGIQENLKLEFAQNANQPTGTKKRCLKCCLTKAIECFSFLDTLLGKRQTYCKDCTNSYSRRHYIANKDRKNKMSKKWQSEHRDKAKEYQKKHRELGLKKETDKNWVSNNRDKVHQYQKKYYDKRRRGDIKYRIGVSISSGIRQSLKRDKGGYSWSTLVDYDYDQLKKHLEKRFKSGMTWDNYGSYWHIDHIIPKSVFNYQTTDDLDFKKCWSLKNLQPLEAHNNQVKCAKLDKPFQPSLTINIERQERRRGV